MVSLKQMSLKYRRSLIMSKKELSFENALSNLEEIVLKLEKDDVPLEEAIDLYQQGMNLSKLCSEKLNNAEEKVVQILNQSNETDDFVLEEE